MPGDYSRRSFVPGKGYAAVQLQQGRVLTDADFNEQVEIGQHRTRTEAEDVIGPTGVPKQTGGFEIQVTPDGRDLRITAGRIYVGGLLCENLPADVPLTFPQNLGARQARIGSLRLGDRS